MKVTHAKSRPPSVLMIFTKWFSNLEWFVAKRPQWVSNKSAHMRFTYQARNKAQNCWLNSILSSRGHSNGWPSPTLALVTMGVPYLCTMTLAWLGAMVPTSPAYDDSEDQKQWERNGERYVNFDSESTFTFTGFFSNTWTYLAASNWHLYPKFQSSDCGWKDHFGDVGETTARTKSKSREESSRGGTVAVTFSARQGDRAKCDRRGSSPGLRLPFPCPFGVKILPSTKWTGMEPEGLSTCGKILGVAF